MQTVEDLYNKH